MVHTSMGPRPASRGNDVVKEEEVKQGMILQWGRDPLVAEILPPGWRKY